MDLRATSTSFLDRGELKMQVQLTVLDNLGIKMYASLPPVLSEMVANAWDADATEICIRVPEGPIDAHSSIEVKDNGQGMAFQDLNGTYLSIGRNRRDNPETAVSRIFNRPVMGRKGIGKLSGFGVAQVVELETTKDNETTMFTLDLEEIRSTDATNLYEPRYSYSKADGLTPGTTVRFRNLSRKKRVDIDDIRVKIARRFSCLDTNFRIFINDVEITPAERDLKSKCEYHWQIDEDISASPKRELLVKGWIGTTPEPVDSSVGSGIVIMVRGKLAQEPTHFEVTGSWNNIANPYMVGELHADFLDDDEDLIVTNRGSIVWDSEEGQLLRDWGRDKVREIATEWSKERKKKKEAVVRSNPDFEEWLKRLSTSERRLADKVISTITNSQLEDGRILELAGYIKESFDFQVFRELIASLSDTDNPDESRIIELFEEWGVIEAKEIQRIAEGRLATIEKLEDYILNNAREVPELHKFFAEYPWIIDPTWTIAHDEVHFSSLLRSEFPQDKLDEKDRRIDFVCLGAGDTIHIVELKRPKHKINIDDLQQLEHYVAFIRSRLGNAPNGRSYRAAAGYIIGGEVSSDYQVPDKIQRLERDRIYVRRYDELLSVAKRLHSDFQVAVGSVAKKSNVDA